VNGTVVWLTGLPAAGKSTLAETTAAVLREHGVAAVILDSDAVRATLSPAPGYTEEERAHFYRTLGGLAALIAGQGLVVLVPATAHRRAHRDHARARSPRFVEVYVEAGPDECARRDEKGLYAAARAGAIRSLPGVGAAYEAPELPDIVARGGRDPAAVDRIVRAVCAEAT
jgi:adenylylsulfate kinase